MLFRIQSVSNSLDLHADHAQYFVRPDLGPNWLQRSSADDLVGKEMSFVCLILFDLILYVHSTIFQLCGTVLPGLNQY